MNTRQLRLPQPGQCQSPGSRLIAMMMCAQQQVSSNACRSFEGRAQNDAPRRKFKIQFKFTRTGNGDAATTTQHANHFP